MYSDSQSAIHLVNNQVYHARTKHIDVRYHFIREILKEGGVRIQKTLFCNTDNNNSSSIEADNKGELPIKRNTVAIKCIMNRGDSQGEQGFFREEILSSCKHPNIVSLLGYCDEGGEMILENCKDDLQISIESINLAIKNFSDKNCIERGRYWKAYKGELTHAKGNTTIVAKWWDRKCSQGGQQFLKELDILFKCKHGNIISLVGYCKEMDENIIVYEHALKGSLNKDLKDASLTWVKRLKICIDVAVGLDTLYKDHIVTRGPVSRSITTTDDVVVTPSSLSSSNILSYSKSNLSNPSLICRCQNTNTNGKSNADEDDVSGWDKGIKIVLVLWLNGLMSVLMDLGIIIMRMMMMMTWRLRMVTWKRVSGIRRDGRCILLELINRRRLIPFCRTMFSAIYCIALSYI
nr:protein kinase-like domain, phloem protein 2-like protein [Tanacetum cinerariifolium]